MKAFLTIAIFIFLAGTVEAKTIRATEMSATLWSEISQGTAGDITVEFRQGDELPVSVTADGDLMQTTKPGVSYVSIKKNFWLRLQASDVQLSLDGTNYRNIKDALSGRLEAGAGAIQNGGTARAIDISFKAYLK